MDRFMIHNFIRCIVSPFQSYGKEKVEFYYILHSYMERDIFQTIDMMRLFFPFFFVALHDKQMLMEEHQTYNQQKPYVGSDLFFEDYSLYRVKRMWKRIMAPLDLVIYSRLDVLYSKPLTTHDITLVLQNKNHMFLSDTSVENLRRGFVIGSPFVMNIYADRVNCMADHFSIADLTHHPIRLDTVSVTFVRIQPEGEVHTDDWDVCPYLKDMLTSSTTKVCVKKK